VDLKEVHARLVDIEKDIIEAREKHNGFLKDLGLPSLLGSDK